MSKVFLTLTIGGNNIKAKGYASFSRLLKEEKIDIEKKNLPVMVVNRMILECEVDDRI